MIIDTMKLIISLCQFLLKNSQISQFVQPLETLKMIIKEDVLKKYACQWVVYNIIN